MILNRIFRRETEVDEQLDQGLKKTRRGVFAEITALFDRSSLDEEFYEDLEALLIQADIGVETTLEIVEALRSQVEEQRITEPAPAKMLLRDEMVRILAEATRNRKVKIFKRGTPFVTLVVGVNGTGKTTSIAKLAHFHKGRGRNVMLVAGDTFRAAAIDQIKVWGERVDVPVIAHDPGADPGAVIFDGMQAAYARNADILLVDTAGRLHTKYNLMEELSKIKRVMRRHVEEAPQEVLLVIDATTGQNGLAQAKKFADSVEITDIMIAKLDGTAKGGIAFAISRQLGIPISYVGTGEKLDDFAEFNHEAFVDSLFFEEGEAPAAG